MSTLNAAVGKKIKYYRHLQGLSQEELALESNMHRAYIGQIERGEKNIGINNLYTISRALKVKVSKLLPDNV